MRRREACCLSSICSQRTETNCSAVGGKWKGTGVSCTLALCSGSPSPSAQPPGPSLGACCLSSVCSQRTETNCSSVGGKWKGTGVSCTPTLCSASPRVLPPSSSSSSSVSSSSVSLSPFNTYEAHPCGHYCPTNCNQWTDISGQGIDIKVPRLKDQGGLIKCYQPWYANSSIMITLYYKFAYINFPAGSTYSDGCYLLLKKKCDGPNIPELLPSLNKKYSGCYGGRPKH